MPPDLLKGNTIAAIVPAVRAESDGTARERFAYDRSDLTDTVILRIIPHIEYFVVDLITRCFECKHDGLGDIRDMNQRPPRRAVTGHLDFFCGPGKSGQIIENNVKAHARTCTECG